MRRPGTTAWNTAVAVGRPAGVLCGWEVRRCAAAVLCVLALVAGGRAATRQQEAQFLAGCEILATAAQVTPARKAAAFRWLIRHTGVTPVRATQMLESYRSRPDEWRRMLDAVRGSLEDAGKAEPDTAAPAKQRGVGHGTR